MLTNISEIIKAVLAVIILVIIVLFFWNEHADQKKIVALTTTNVVQGGVIKSQETAIQTQSSVAKTTQVINTAVEVETKKVVKDQAVVVDKLEQKTRVIEQSFATKPSTAANSVLQQTQLSTARIDSLWEGYCAGGADNQQCKDIEQGVNHA